jgi:Acetyltransferase (GNAT) family
MLEFERNTPVDASILAEFFARCGWQELEAGAKLEWALVASEEWVVCRLDGELIGFGRSCRLGPMRRVVFDVLVDSRFQGAGLRREIVRLLSENAGSLEEVSVFTEREAYPLRTLGSAQDDRGPARFREAPPGAYLGKRHPGSAHGAPRNIASREDRGASG